MGVVVRKPGVSTTVQDLGRIGYLGSGFSPSGVMDRRAYRIANLLVENDPDDPVLEFALAGPTLRFTNPTFIAITGGDFSPKLDGKPIAPYTTVQVRRGSILSFGAPVRGVYSYLAIAGHGLEVPEVMGSRSTNLKCSIGGWHGRTLEMGDYLPYVGLVDYMANLGSHALPYDMIYNVPGNLVVLRVVPGPQEDMFTQQGLDTFYDEDFTTTVKSDRMGFRLDGPEVQTKHGSDIISDGIAFGAVQIPSHGRPIIMLADRQTTGGYAKIGTIAGVDIPKLVQSPPGTTIRFKRISVQEAQALVRDEARSMEALSVKVRRPCAGGLSPRRTARRLKPILEQQALASRHDTLWISGADNSSKANKEQA